MAYLCVNKNGEYCINYEIFLPHGTIEKIIGKKMSWENDPVEI